MKHFVVGYRDASRKSAVTVLYAGDSRAEARKALFAGGEGIVLADYICNPQVSQAKRFRSTAATAEVVPAPAEKQIAKPKVEKATQKPVPLPSPLPLTLPGKHTPLDTDAPE